MKCTDFEDRLNEVLDLRLAPEADVALQTHADECADCRELLLAQEHLFAGLSLAQSTLQIPELGPAVLAELRPVAAPLALPPIPSESRRFGWLTLLASAAAVLFAVSFGVWVANQQRQQPAAGVGNSNQVGRDRLAVIKPGTTRVKPVEPPKDGSQQGVPLPPVTATEESVASAPGVQQPLSPALPSLDPNSEAYRRAVASLSSHWPAGGQWSAAGQWSPVETLNVQQVEQYAPSIRPIRESFEVALDALLKTLPGKKDTTRPTQPQAQQLPDAQLHLA